MANQIFYNAYCSGVFKGEIQHLTDDIRLMLLKDTYVFDGNAHVHLDQIISNEVTGTGYTSLGQSLSSKTLIVDTVNLRVRYDAADISWLNSSFTARYGLIYKWSGDPITSPPMFLLDFLTNQTCGGGDFVLQFDTIGVAYMKGI